MNTIEQLEEKVAEFFGAPFAVAVDCCTHALELCLRLLAERDAFPYQYTCPPHTYLSVPMTFEKLHLDWNFVDTKWEKCYTIGNTNIIDAAVLWEKDSYIPSSMMCLSFQLRKHLSLGKGGMILLDNAEDANILRQTRYDGRPDLDRPWADQNITMFGYHYQMTYETAQIGLDKFDDAVTRIPKHWTYKDYPDLSTYKIFQRGILH
jgi:dTDP-4-amino-4,6-dideoxygalactose transaminase|tara:strand:+ start:79 stop:696 length:618 start_codon:yes stop_codon:yes gene_type:complete